MAGPGNRRPITHRARDESLNLVACIGDLLRLLGGDEIGSFALDWPREWRRRQPASPCTLPVLARMTEFASDPQSFGGAVIAELCRLAPRLAWRQTYTCQEVGEAFLDNYGWTEILGESGLFISDSLACGFLVLGPGTRYPSHRHPAQEIYIPLSGTAQWQQGDTSWTARQPGAVIFHSSEEPHALHTGAQPLLAMYLWRGSMAASRLC